MKYFVIALMIALGWALGSLIVEVIREITFERLHRTQWYARICGRITKDEGKQKNRKDDRRIGF